MKVGDYRFASSRVWIITEPGVVNIEWIFVYLCVVTIIACKCVCAEYEHRILGMAEVQLLFFHFLQI